MVRRINVLVTGAGSPGFPGVVQSLKTIRDYRIHIVGTDMCPQATGRFLANSFHVVPPASNGDFISSLQSICQKEHVDVVLPMVSAELLVLSRHAEEFAVFGTQVSISNTACLQQVMHKGFLMEKLKEEGVSVPDSITVRTVDELLQAISQLGYPNRAVCFKPIFGDGSRGFRILDPLIDRQRLLFSEKPNSAYLSYSELLTTLENVKDIPELLVMEFLPNEEYSVDILADKGNVLVAVPRTRSKTVNGITTDGVIRREDDVTRYASQIVKIFGLQGNIGVQVRRNAAQVPQIIEVNPRIQGTIVHCTAGGVNLPFLAVKLALGMPMDSFEYQIRWGTRMTRYWKEVFYHPNGEPFEL